MKTINDSNYKELIKNDILMIFTASWCGHCKPMKERLLSLTDNFYACDIDDSPEMSEFFNIASIPTIIVYKDGEEKSRLIGARTNDELKSII